ncbi:MAG TPA: hypothetical protein VK506_04785 [Conexibacter sp.]|nr:hypothetical protein [Conexibacter sp.]
MPKPSKLAIAAFVAALMLVSASASATRLSLDDQDFAVQWDPFITYFNDEVFGLACSASAAGRFHEAVLQKVAQGLVGSITEAAGSIGGCRTLLSVLAESLPWHMTYESFTGTLPAIGSVAFLLIGASFVTGTGGGFTCLARSTSTEPIRLIATIGAGGVITELRLDETRTIDPIDLPGSGACDVYNYVRFGGGGSVEDGTGGQLRLTLI